MPQTHNAAATLAPSDGPQPQPDVGGEVALFPFMPGGVVEELPLSTLAPPSALPPPSDEPASALKPPSAPANSKAPMSKGPTTGRTVLCAMPWYSNVGRADCMVPVPSTKVIPAAP